MAEPQSSKAQLHVTGGPTNGQVFAIEKNTTILVGSGPGADLQIPVEGVGEAHLKVQWDDLNGLVIIDNGSDSGTFVNGVPLLTGPLFENDRIEFGPPGANDLPWLLVKIPPPPLVFDLEEPAAAPPPVAPPPTRAPARHDTSLPAIIFDDEPPPAVAPRLEKTAGSTAAPTPPPRTPAPPILPPPRPAAAPAPRPRVPAPPAGKPGAAKPTGRMPSVPPLWIGAGVGVLLLVLVGGYLLTRKGGGPALLDVTPSEGVSGDVLKIRGSGFLPQPGENTVRFGDVAVPPREVTADTITVAVPTIPQKAGGVQELTITVETPDGASSGIVFRLRPAPRVFAPDPEAARPGDVIALKGQDLKEPVTVTIGGLPAEVQKVESQLLRVKVPALWQRVGEAVPVTVSTKEGVAKPVELVIGQLPMVLEALPPRGEPGSRVVLRGRGFVADPKANQVTLGGMPALVLSASARELHVAVPPVAGADELHFTVDTGGKRANGDPAFSLAGGGIGAYALRFAIAPGADATQVQIVTSFAPVMLLADADGRPSVAMRAFEAAAALTEIAGARLSDPRIGIEARSTPASGVARTGAPGLLLKATDSDVAAYARAGGKGVTPATLSAHWAALVTDYLTLFVDRQRPVRLLTSTPRARAFDELAAETRWEPGRQVQERSLVALPAGLVARLREMALLVGGAAAQSVAALAEGRWEGSLEDEELGTRPITIRLAQERGRWRGTLRGSTGMSFEAPLREVTVKGNAVTLVIPLGAAPRRLVGTLEGGALSGAVHGLQGRLTGKFSLRYVP